MRQLSAAGPAVSKSSMPTSGPLLMQPREVGFGRVYVWLVVWVVTNPLGWGLQLAAVKARVVTKELHRVKKN